MPRNEELAQYLANQEGINPDVLAMTLKALSPKTPWAETISDVGETKFTFVPPEVKAAKEKEKAQPGQPGQPARAGGIGFDPATAALMAPPGEPITAASLRGLTPEQIMAVMGTEAEAERARQGTIGQLMELPYRRAMTERAMRPDLSMEIAKLNKQLGPVKMMQFMNAALQYQALGEISGKSMAELKDISPEILIRAGVPPSLISEIYKEERLPKKAEWLEWRHKETGEIKAMRPGEVPTPGADWEKMPTREVEIREMVYQKKLPVTAAKELRSYVTKKDKKTGKVTALDPEEVNRVGISALSEVLLKEGKEVVEIDIPAVAKPFWPDKKARSIFLIVPEGAARVSEQDIKNTLTSVYGYSAEEADKAVKAMK